MHTLTSTVYHTCYPLSLTRNDSSSSIKGGIREDCSSGSSSGSETEEDNFSYEEHCAPELKDILIDRLEIQIEVLAKRVFGSDRFKSGLRETLSQAVDEILRLSEDEPYGVRGASVSLKVISPKGVEYLLGTISMDESTISTFKLVLVLKEVSRISLSIKNWFGQLTGCGTEHQIGPDYALSKKQLYRYCHSFESPPIFKSI